HRRIAPDRRIFLARLRLGRQQEVGQHLGGCRRVGIEGNGDEMAVADGAASKDETANRIRQFTCGDQDRGNFTIPERGGLSRGGVAIADPDEWDDFDANGVDPSGQGTFDGFMTTPAISLDGVEPGTLSISFFSSWRDEAPQQASLEVSFDGGATYSPVFVWSGDSASPDFKNDAPNEIVTYAVANPAGAASARFRFALTQAGNNWWWAVDSIQVSGDRSGAAANAPGFSFVQAETFNDSARPVIEIGQAIGATSYSVLVAKDEAFSDIRLEAAAGQAGSFQIPAIPNGIYFVKTVAQNDAGSRDSENSVRIVVDNPIFADLDGNGSLNFFDISRYVQIFNEGCQ
ncbi:hypothetical protein, partial [Nodularia spumigena]|uniref:hypothetical protein n=1 Tax=Nodularia spumigena TaxID=70799 RepID=UPI002B1F4467